LRECRNRFDSSRLFQLTFKTRTSPGRRELTKSLVGRELFGEGITFTQLRDMHEAGAVMKSTKLSTEFTYQDFIAKYGEHAVVMCSIDGEGMMKINTIDVPLVPLAGQTIVALVTVTPVPPQHASQDNGSRT